MTSLHLVSCPFFIGADWRSVFVVVEVIRVKSENEFSQEGCDIECFVTEVRISRLRLTTQAIGEKSLRTLFLAKITSSISKKVLFELLQVLKH